MEDEIRKKILREEMKKKNQGKSITTAKYHPHYPDSIEREYIRLVNEYMMIEKQIIQKYIPELKRIIGEGTAPTLNTDSKRDNERKRKHTRMEKLSNIIRLQNLFETILRELESAFGLFRLSKMLKRIADLEHKLSVKEWKKVISKTFGINLLEDYYSGDVYEELLRKWVSDNVDLIKQVPKESLGKMKEIVYESYMNGVTTTDIVKAIQRQYGIDKRHAKLIARDQTSKLNAALTQHQQRDAGVEKYEWDDSHDKRVRDGHRRLRGMVFSWNSPPETAKGRRCHPGEDYQCRCCALPVFDIDKLDLPV